MNLKRQLLRLLVFTLAIALVGIPGSAQGQQPVKNPDTLIFAMFGEPEPEAIADSPPKKTPLSDNPFDALFEDLA